MNHCCQALDLGEQLNTKGRERPEGQEETILYPICDNVRYLESVQTQSCTLSSTVCFTVCKQHLNFFKSINKLKQK